MPEAKLASSSAIGIEYISAAANRHPRAAHCSDESLIAFGTSSLVALWHATDDEDAGIQQTLPGHEGTVTCIRFRDNKCFYSADDKGCVRCWALSNGEWTAVGHVQAHSEPISSLATFDECLATGSSDGTIAIWQHASTHDDFKLVQTIDLKKRYSFDIQITKLPSSSGLVMATCGTEKSIAIYTRSHDSTFVKSASLAGHEDWVKSLAFRFDGSSLILASGSQDGNIRLWNINKEEKEQAQNEANGSLSDELLDSFEASLGDFTDGEEGGRQISLKRHIFAVRNDLGSLEKYSITFDALLIGHEAGVTSVTWRPSSVKSSPPTLMSTSVDSSIIHWSPQTISGVSEGEASSIWINQQRFGDIGGQRLGGFVGGFWSRGGSDTLAWGWSGGWRRWRASFVIESTGTKREVWREANAVGGHIGPVRSVAWSPGGEYLISTGPDQTTRIHGNIKSKDQTQGCWHEICRPQVHGYDLVDATFLGATRFVSIADEKVARVFDAPRTFVTLAKHLGILSADESEERPAAAAVPPLGLSNKALSEQETAGNQFLPFEDMTKRRPFEGELAISTLWPESEKIFGHGYELHAVAVSHSKGVLATSCRTTTPEHAGIKLYETTTWQPIGQTLLGHQLTITRIAFSPDDKYILSVSRDRTWCLFESIEGEYKFVKSSKVHSRIIWDCAWTHEGDLFATASRDKTVKLWKTEDVSQKQQAPFLTIKCKEAATALSFSSTEAGRRRMAVGLEDGTIAVYEKSSDLPEKWEEKMMISRRHAHVSQINRLDWRPNVSGLHQLASGSDDGTLRILDLNLQ